METCEVLIVGGGPAGSSCAWALRKAGLDVLVLDRARFPRDKVCAGWITPAVVDELELDLEDYRQGRVLQPITGFRTSVMGGPEVATAYGRPVSYGIRRCEFDHYLLERSGARLRLGMPLASMRRDGDRWIVNDEIAAPLVVGAGGHFCPVARLTTEASEGDEIVVVAQEIEFEMKAGQVHECRVEEPVPELFFCEDLKGYAWCFRKENVLNIGLGRESEKRLSPQVERLFAWLVERGRIPRQAIPRFHGHAYRLYVGPRRGSTDDRVLLIGDAAGLAYPQSGEGIRPAVESGLLAAAAIVATPAARRHELAARLEGRLRERFGRPGRAHGLGTRIPPSWRSFAARRLLASPWFSRHVLIERWFLHMHQPPLRIAGGGRA
jgi:geranylgeranyl reductase family protein